MIQVSTQIANAINQDSRTFDAKIYYNGTEISVDIKDLTIYKGACGDFAVGSIFVPYFDMTCYGDVDVEGKLLLLKLGVKFNNTFTPVTDHYIDMGYFKATTVEKTETETRFTAVGKLADSQNITYIDELPRTVATVKGKIQSLLGTTIVGKGVTFDDTEIVPSIINASCRDALGVLASVLGAFVTEDNAGNIVISKFGGTPVTNIGYDRMRKMPLFGIPYTLNTFKITIQDGYQDSEGREYPPVVVPENPVDNPDYVASNPYMSAELYTQFYTNLHGFTIPPADFEVALGDPRLEPWDVVNIGEVGDYTAFPCLNITFKYDGGLSMNLSARVQEQNKENLKGAIQIQLDKLTRDVLGNSKEIKEIKEGEIGLETYMFVAYSNDRLGADFDYEHIDREYRGVYISTSPEAPELTADPNIFKWDVNPYWASKIATNYLFELNGGLKIYPPESIESDGEVYLGLTATQIAFIVNSAARLTLGLDQTFGVYGMSGETLMLKGSGSSLRFDNGRTGSSQGQFIMEDRENGHFTMKKGLTSED